MECIKCNTYRRYVWGTPFNQNISSWDVSNVTIMASMFRETTSFNQNIGTWKHQM